MDSAAELGAWPPVLPTLAARETLYSWCATVHRRSVSGNVLVTSRRLFGSSYSGLLHDFPARLGELARRTEGRVGAPRDLALKHTLLGYFLPFIGAASGEAILAAVEAGAVPDLKTRLGIPASGIGGYHPLRWCPECVRRDRHDTGWPIWHLDHQPPSTLVCTEHQRPLMQTWHTISPVHRREWLVPEGSSSEPRYEVKIRDDKTLAILLRLARLSADVFELEPGWLDPSATSRIYRTWAANNGAVTSGGSLRLAAVQGQLQPSLSLLNQAFEDLGPVSCTLHLPGILSSVMRSTPKPAHPTKHLVLMALMFEQQVGLPDITSAVLSAEKTEECYRAAPAEHGQLRELDAVRALFLELVGTRQSVRSAAIEVGVSATTGVRWAVQAGVSFTSRAKSMKGDILAGIVAALSKGVDRVDVSRDFGVSVASVNRLLSTSHALRDKWVDARHEHARRSHRAAIQAAYAQDPQCTQRELRARHGASWTWLYRHDRKWLIAAAPCLWD